MATLRRRQPKRIRRTPASATFVKPMLATLVDRPFDRDGWLFEIKWDGYRAIAEVEQGGVRLYSRRQESFAERFPPIVEALAKIPHDCVLDGEIVVVDAEGRPSFQRLQQYAKTPGAAGSLVFYVFDVLSLDGQDLRFQPLARRKESLNQLVDGGRILSSDHVEREGIRLFDEAVKRGLEGIIAKNGKSPYREGIRSYDWLKIKALQRQEAVVCGFTRPRGARQGFGALILGVYEDSHLAYVGHTGTGFDAATLTSLHARLLQMAAPDCPFAVRPKTNQPATWVRPELVCEIQFLGWTDDGIMRQPSFLGLRDDKPASLVRRETARPVRAVVP